MAIRADDIADVVADASFDSDESDFSDIFGDGMQNNDTKIMFVIRIIIKNKEFIHIVTQ